MESGLPDSVRALAEADFTRVAEAFAGAGFTVRQPVRGILELSRTEQEQPRPRPRLVLSVGIHGDETAPIEILAHLLADLSAEPHALAADVMVVVGNLAAIAAGKRFIDADLNRMFKTDRGALRSAMEAERADDLMRAVTSFFSGSDGPKWHLDLHTAIRPSRYPKFAIVPESDDEARAAALLGWLGQAGLDAVILNRKPAGTFSSWTAREFGAAACTMELGQIAALGTNDLTRFAATQAALDALLRDAAPSASADGRLPLVFEVAQELVKQTENFSMTVPRGTDNFTPLEPGTLIAQDGEQVYRVGAKTEYVVFPNPDVRVGLRAGLLVVQRS